MEKKSFTIGKKLKAEREKLSISQRSIGELIVANALLFLKLGFKFGNLPGEVLNLEFGFFVGEEEGFEEGRVVGFL